MAGRHRAAVVALVSFTLAALVAGWIASRAARGPAPESAPAFPRFAPPKPPR